MDRKRIRHRLSRQTITEAAIITAVLAFLSKVVGYVRDMLTAKYFGTSMQMDAFEVALIIPNMILGLFAAGLQTIIVRMYSEKKEESMEKGKVFVNQLFFIYSIFLFIITILIIVFSPAAVKIVAAGFTSDRLNYASTFVKMLAIFGYLNVMTGFFTGVFQAEKQFFLSRVSWSHRKYCRSCMSHCFYSFYWYLQQGYRSGYVRHHFLFDAIRILILKMGIF